MKLIVAMGIEEDTQLLRLIFQEHDVLIYSEAPVEGFRPRAKQTDPANWFASNSEGVFSRVVFAFVEDQIAAKLIEAVRERNTRDHLRNPLHAFQLKVEDHS